MKIGGLFFFFFARVLFEFDFSDNFSIKIFFFIASLSTKIITAQCKVRFFLFFFFYLFMRLELCSLLYIKYYPMGKMLAQVRIKVFNFSRESNVTVRCRPLANQYKARYSTINVYIATNLDFFFFFSNCTQ